MASVSDNLLLKEKEHVHDVYSKIASHFSDTRYKAWPRIAEFLNSLPSGSSVADIGCGNGKYLGVNANVHVIGCDICPELISIAKERGHEVLISDCLSLPYRESVFDAVICIAVLHHLSSEERRIAGVREIVRILEPGGQALIYVWAMEQTRKKFDSQDAMVPWHMQLKYLPDNCTAPTEQVKKTKKKWRKKKYVKKSKVIDKTDESTVNDHPQSPDGTNHTPLPDSSAIGQTQGPDGTRTSHTPSPFNESLLCDICQPSIDSEQKAVDHTHTSDSDDVTNDIEKKSVSDSSNEFKTFYRYYHVFCEGELTRLCTSINNVTVKDTWYDHENWCILFEKKDD